MKDKEVLTLDESKIIATARACAEDLNGRMRNNRTI